MIFPLPSQNTLSNFRAPQPDHTGALSSQGVDTAMRSDRASLPKGSPHTGFGAVAQLGERYNGIVEVVGSIPSGSTSFLEIGSPLPRVQRFEHRSDGATVFCLVASQRR